MSLRRINRHPSLKYNRSLVELFPRQDRSGSACRKKEIEIQKKRIVYQAITVSGVKFDSIERDVYSYFADYKKTI